MKKNQFLLALMCLFVTFTSLAGAINEKQAQQVAAKFMASHAIPSNNLIMAQKAPSLNASPDKAAYYVFNGNQGGYVIVAGDDRAPAVLGYSDRGTFDANDVPEAMQELLESYAAQIQALSDGAQVDKLASSGTAIRPLVPAVWSQNNPYNILFPYVTSGKHAVVGCVATAMAQVLYYWKWPVRATMPIPAYTSSSLNIEMPELPVIDFNWEAMQDTYMTTDTTSVAALAASTLSLYCAQAVEMDFQESSSGATSARIPLKLSTYFDYDKSAHTLYRANYSTQGWADVIYSELAAGRPVIFSGRKSSSGHAFVCDGYDGNSMFHINWGWNGLSNGYFLLNVLNPDEQGTGSASGAYGYIYRQAAIVGIQPNKGGHDTFELTIANMTLNSYSDSRWFNSFSFEANVSGQFHNYTSQVMPVRFGWGLFQGDTMLSNLYSSYNTSLNPGSYLNIKDKELSFGSNITSGTYRILPMYSEYGVDNWRPCVGADRNYIEVTINGNNCTITGYGTAGERNYTINDITYEGTMHNGRPVNIDVNMTNNGNSSNELLYMFADGTFVSTGYVGLEPGETGDVHFKYLFDTAGDHTLTWSWNDDGSNPIATRTITINPMPAASLSATIRVLDVTDTDNRIITSDKFSIELTITNNGTTTYDEEISAKLFKRTQGTSGSNVQGKNQHLVLAPGETTTMRFDMDNVIEGWYYFAKSYYYSEGKQQDLKGTTSYTLVFPEEPEVMFGDVDGDKEISIKDVSALIDYLLTGDDTGINLANADVNKNSEITIADVSALIDFLLDN